MILAKLKFLMFVPMTLMMFGAQVSWASQVGAGPRPAMPQATIEIRGDAGAGQDRTAEVFRLKRDTHGIIALGSLSTDPQIIPLNTPNSFPEGAYFLNYSHTVELVDLKRGEQKVVALQKLEIPKIDGTYSFSVIWDLTDKATQDLTTLWYWASTSFNLRGGISFSAACRAGRDDVSVVEFCRAVRSGNPKNFFGPGIQYGADGFYSTFTWSISMTDSGIRSSSGDMTAQSPITIGGGADGDFISVLPGGKYILIYKSVEGQSFETPGNIPH